MAPWALKPDYIVRTVFDIDFRALRERGVRAMAFDLENTLGLMGCTHLDDRTEGLLVWLRLYGFGICLGTNCPGDLRHLEVFAGNIVQPANGLRSKPHPDFFRRILAVMGSKPEETAMVGDKLAFDTSPAGQLGLVTVLVNPIGRDTFADLLKAQRLRERRALRRLGITRP